MPTNTFDVNDPRRKPYKRTIRTSLVTYECAECGREVTEQLYPYGSPIKWCDNCRRDVKRRQTRERVRRHRARKKAASKSNE